MCRVTFDMYLVVAAIEITYGLICAWLGYEYFKLKLKKDWFVPATDKWRKAGTDEK